VGHNCQLLFVNSFSIPFFSFFSLFLYFSYSFFFFPHSRLGEPISGRQEAPTAAGGRSGEVLLQEDQLRRRRTLAAHGRGGPLR
jgi:hypothetical protein